MARQYRFTCDGCDVTHLNPNNVLPLGWSVVAVNLEGLEYPVAHGNGTKRFDLCSGCMSHLNDRANPRRWPRAEAAGSKE
jgi:hypothetical protein